MCLAEMRERPGRQFPITWPQIPVATQPSSLLATRLCTGSDAVGVLCLPPHSQLEPKLPCHLDLLPVYFTLMSNFYAGLSTSCEHLVAGTSKLPTARLPDSTLPGHVLWSTLPAPHLVIISVVSQPPITECLLQLHCLRGRI